MKTSSHMPIRHPNAVVSAFMYSMGAARFLCLCIPAISVLLQPPLASADEPYWHSVIPLFQSQDYKGAHEEVERLLQAYPGDPLLLRLKGICAMELGDYDAATRLLAQAVEKDPESIASRYYYAQALAYRGSVPEAISVLRGVITLAPDSEYAQKSREILPQIENLAGTVAAVPDERRWNFYARVAAEYDDNVPARAKDSPDDTPQDSWRTTYSIYGEVRFPDQKIDRAPITLGLGYSINGSVHERSSFQSYDLFSQSASLYLSRSDTVWGRFFTARLTGNYNDTQLDGKDFSRLGGLEGSFDYYWHEKVTSKAVAGWADKDFDDDSDFPDYYSRDGDAYRIGLRNYVYLMGNRLVLGLHYMHRTEDTDGRQFDVRSNDLTGSMNAYLPWGFRLTGSVGYQQEDYTEYTPDPKRLDNVWTFYTALERTFWRDWLNWEINYTYNTADSNWGFADYRRNVTGLSLVANY